MIFYDCAKSYVFSLAPIFTHLNTRNTTTIYTVNTPFQ